MNGLTIGLYTHHHDPIVRAIDKSYIHGTINERYFSFRVLSPLEIGNETKRVFL